MKWKLKKYYTNTAVIYFKRLSLIKAIILSTTAILPTEVTNQPSGHIEVQLKAIRITIPIRLAIFTINEICHLSPAETIPTEATVAIIIAIKRGTTCSPSISFSFNSHGMRIMPITRNYNSTTANKVAILATPSLPEASSQRVRR